MRSILTVAVDKNRLAVDKRPRRRPCERTVDTAFSDVAVDNLRGLYKRDPSLLASLFLSTHECKLINQRACAYLIRNGGLLGNGYIPLVVGNLLPILVLVEQ